jgi:hypothetical protein
MRIRRPFPLVLVVVVVAAAVTVAVQLRKEAPPEPARLLPSADAFLYVNLGWARKLNPDRGLPSVSHDPDYERFIQDTGFEFERDLDAAAFAVHFPTNWGGGPGNSEPEPRFSEVFVGKFDGARIGAYLKQHAQSVENYQSVDIFTIPLEGRSFRVAILGVDSVACSNHDDPAVIRGIVDRSRRLASPFGGPAFLRRYYKRVQFASPLWLVAHVQPNAPEFGGWGDVFSKPADIVISTGYNPLHLPLRPGALHLRAEALTTNADDARSIAEKLNTYLTIFHSAEGSVGDSGTDADVKAVFDSLQVRQDGDHVTLNAAIPPGFLKKMLADSSEGVASPGAQRPAPSGSR